jgi:hypothetical protein
MLLEGLPWKDLGEDVGGIVFGTYVHNGHDAGTTHLAQLELLAVDVSRVLGGRESMAKVMSSFIVGAHFDRRVAAVPNVPERSVDVGLGARLLYPVCKYRMVRGRSR